ncbi:hypothetical protein [Constrictibacter sp. MBR-5]|uniref:hypothetical protein n=1 Tax=Constrictibacter sp. MBR-5 TaxID=3156467 RepID=UPI0033944F8C
MPIHDGQGLEHVPTKEVCDNAEAGIGCDRYQITRHDRAAGQVVEVAPCGLGLGSDQNAAEILGADDVAP